MNSGIYALVNTNNGKRYIGRTVDFTKRRTMHLWQLKNGRHFNKHLQRAWDNGGRFTFEILETCERNECNQKEVWWIKHYRTQNPEYGYNICDGGKTTDGYHFTDEQKKKISDANAGRHYADDVINARKESLRKHLKEDKQFAEKYKKNRIKAAKMKKPWNVGKKQSDDFKKKVSEKLKGRTITEAHKKKLRQLYSGEKSLTAKLKVDDVIKIRVRFLSGERQSEIRMDYPQISAQTIYDIVRNRRWKSIPNNLLELEAMNETRRNW